MSRFKSGSRRPILIKMEPEKTLKRLMQFTIFLFIFASIYYLMAAYATFRLFYVFEWSGFWWMAMIIALSNPISALVDRLWHCKLTSKIYFVSSALFGIITLLFSFMLLSEIANIFFPVFRSSWYPWFMVIAMVVLVMHSLRNGCCAVVKIIKVGNFGKKLRAVQLTDIHVGTIRNTKYLKGIVDKTNGLNPDVVLITGDLVDGSGKLTKDSFQPLRDLKAPTYFIHGNHETYERIEKVVKLLSKTKIRIMQDEVVVWNGINIIGLMWSESQKYPETVLPKIKYDKSKPTILLNHAPTSVDYIRKQGVNLMLSGHTHYGQIFPGSFLVRYFYKYYRGLYKFKNFTLYVSPGTGTWGPPMRTDSKNEITLIELE